MEEDKSDIARVKDYSRFLWDRKHESDAEPLLLNPEDLLDRGLYVQKDWQKKSVNLCSPKVIHCVQTHVQLRADEAFGVF